MTITFSPIILFVAILIDPDIPLYILACNEMAEEEYLNHDNEKPRK
jgi:hypothetical protein